MSIDPTDDFHQQVRQRWEAGQPLKKLAADLGCSYGRVQRTVRRLRLPLRKDPSGPQFLKDWSHAPYDLVQVVQAAADKGISCNDLARAIGVSTETMRTWRTGTWRCSPQRIQAMWRMVRRGISLP